MNSSDDIKLFTGLNDHKSLSTMVQKSILSTVAILAVFLACFFGVDWTRTVWVGTQHFGSTVWPGTQHFRRILDQTSKSRLAPEEPVTDSDA